MYYKWKEGDTFQSIADEFYAKTQDILEAPVNKLDLTNPTMTSGSYVMVPGGKREAVTWFQGAIPRGSAGTLSHLLGSGGCDTTTAGAVGDGAFGMPIPGGYVVGNDYIEGVHQGLDLGSASSNSILAADDGVVVYAGWANGGYGNTVMIDIWQRLPDSLRPHVYSACIVRTVGWTGQPDWGGRQHGQLHRAALPL